MGKTFVIYKVNPKDLEQLEVTEKELKAVANGDFKDVQRVEVGFGIIVLKVGYLIPEKQDGALEALTKEIESLPSVENAEVEGMTLV
ncbi:MAG: hypothetical protein Q8P05_06000 [Candidatus Diapherotrites archaeon]|nr:hypothetical protein [Candidatus Diapherotrites archaeon]MDZ4256058.1 hypothetical protein [archaeon]